MNETAQQLITDAGAKVLEYLEATEGFAVEQAPLLAQEIVRYGIWWHGGLACVFAVSFLMAAVVFLWAIRGTVKNKWTGDGQWCVKDAYIIGCALSGVWMVIGLSVTLAEMSCLLKALLAPRLYIIEQISGLL